MSIWKLIKLIWRNSYGAAILSRAIQYTKKSCTVSRFDAILIMNQLRAELRYERDEAINRKAMGR